MWYLLVTLQCGIPVSFFIHQHIYFIVFLQLDEGVNLIMGADRLISGAGCNANTILMCQTCKADTVYCICCSVYSLS